MSWISYDPQCESKLVSNNPNPKTSVCSPQRPPRGVQWLENYLMHVTILHLTKQIDFATEIPVTQVLAQPLSSTIRD
jgi:hypothetical protein